MQRHHISLDEIAAPDNLREAFYAACRGKRHTPSVRAFAASLHPRLAALRAALLDETYRFGPYRTFVVYEPKRRIISVAPLGDRVAHHAVMRVCGPRLDACAIHDSYACRAGKGAQRAVLRAQRYSRRFAWFLKLDIAKYFDTIDHGVLLGLLARRFKGAEALRLFERILDSYQTAPGRGLPIGNLTSQHFANDYLGALDHWLKEDRRCAGYVRYMDDFVLWGASRVHLRAALRDIAAFLDTRLKLRLKEATLLNHVNRGMPFLGYRVFPDHIELNRSSKRRFKHKFAAYEARRRDGRWTEAETARRVEALVAFTRFARAEGWRRAVIKECCA